MTQALTIFRLPKKAVMGLAPNQIFEIDSSLKVSFYGGKFSKIEGDERKGYYSGKASPDIWTKVRQIIYSIPPGAYKSDYRGNQDLPGVELVISYKDSTKRIWGKTDAVPVSILTSVDSIFNILNSVVLKKINDTLAFKTGSGVVDWP